ncbi:hypothetical protein LOTGIDRAFT_112226 [Lottia gigantea]|uniref:Protein wntless n=1 Tax=Lottia gigantea TaxID=225164 RepID=V4CFB4_LOTGI|nr:hypothetical protein LOTGIDRAFT_112226 [Lottia gigantea]ESP00710.1 hypothetical protein LOTGIDRAFT_112226 [Lottia gigantea]
MGVVLKTWNIRKLSILAVTVFLLFIAFFLIGGLVAPAPSSVMNMLMTKCYDKHVYAHEKKWYIPRGLHACDQIDDLSNPMVIDKRIDANMVVFALWMPYPREGRQFSMSRWFQNMLTVLRMDIEHHSNNPLKANATMRMEVRLGYRNQQDNESDWKELISTQEDRPLRCDTDGVRKEEDDYYRCELLSFFELGSVHYDYYLINIHLPVYQPKDVNLGLGTIQDIHIITIFQNGGFTKVWFSLKTAMFPVIIVVLVWFWRRVKLLSRQPNLLERTLLTLGIVLSIMNFPVEWLTLWFNLPWMSILSDIRQGAFYATLLSFWMIFAGEHMVDNSVPLTHSYFFFQDSTQKNNPKSYWKSVTSVVFGCLCILIFELSEKGMQLKNPFHTIWVTETGTRVALAFIIISIIAACIYFLFLSYMIYKVFKNTRAQSPTRKNCLLKFVDSRIFFFIFKFLMVLTLLCTALTVIFFIISQISEGQWKWGDDGISLQYTSSLLTGVYGMWNVYVIGLLSLYAPPHKPYGKLRFLEVMYRSENIIIINIKSQGMDVLGHSYVLARFYISIFTARMFPHTLV